MLKWLSCATSTTRPSASLCGWARRSIRAIAGLDFMGPLVKACPQDIVLELERTVLHHDPIELLKRVNVSLNEKDVRAFLSILQRPWFRRVWVVQEVAMSKDSLLLCGAKTFHWP